ncbi:hypothetical protein B0T26DRAFT_332456 [Lasiosphaeria miniovina]|uniref:Uncharacterized protein n=1 Tax=Lasiosphaeria miniovina TaxID=1954250 RepID=A0AA40AMF1_9PEZI|nr:uncharacterized protein B0T26DRAFT_332456 [Lasiosphaeria miniovina]KAK0718514.1 hypothetical protein B0T26DRAFT_332456 [Lasiosphaeria miniovina]
MVAMCMFGFLNIWESWRVVLGEQGLTQRKVFGERRLGGRHKETASIVCRAQVALGIVCRAQVALGNSCVQRSLLLFIVPCLLPFWLFDFFPPYYQHSISAQGRNCTMHKRKPSRVEAPP